MEPVFGAVSCPWKPVSPFFRSLLRPDRPRGGVRRYRPGRRRRATRRRRGATRAGRSPGSFSKAEGYFYKGLYEDAVREYSSLLAAELACRGLRCRAAAFAALHRDDEALADYHRAIELAPRDDEAVLGRGLFHFAHGRFAERSRTSTGRSRSIPPTRCPTFSRPAPATDRQVSRSRHGPARYVHCTVPREETGPASGRRCAN